jgi:hypothetical protein
VDNLEDYESDIARLLLYQPNVSEAVAEKFAALMADLGLSAGQARRQAYGEYFS